MGPFLHLTTIYFPTPHCLFDDPHPPLLRLIYHFSNPFPKITLAYRRKSLKYLQVVLLREVYNCL
jgi:hypothetical protein